MSGTLSLNDDIVHFFFVDLPSETENLVGVKRPLQSFILQFFGH
jgi:hypothetical protein